MGVVFFFFSSKMKVFVVLLALSDAGFFIGSIEGRTVEGTWYEGGRGDRNDWQGSFHIELSADNREFDGYYYRVSQDGAEIRWREERLGAPWPSNPTNVQCL